MRLMNDFHFRGLVWVAPAFLILIAGCPPVPPPDGNDPPVANAGPNQSVNAGDAVTLNGAASSDPDGDSLRFQWQHYAEPGTFRGPPIEIANAATSRATLTLPHVEQPATLHVLLIVTDGGQPALTRYGRVVVQIEAQSCR